MRTWLGELGVWAHETKLNAALARELEDLGYGAIWVGGSPGGDLGIVTELLSGAGWTAIIIGLISLIGIWLSGSRPRANEVAPRQRPSHACVRAPDRKKWTPLERASPRPTRRSRHSNSRLQMRW